MANIEDRTYSTRMMKMNDGAIFPVRMDDWYWHYYDWLVSDAVGRDADKVREFCLETSKSYARNNNIDDPVAAFTHTLAYWVQESVRYYGADPDVKRYQSA